MTATVELHDLTKSFGRHLAVDGVTDSFGGGVVGLLGPNGAGKSTLLRMVATLLTPDAGSLRILGLDPRRPGARLEIRRQLGYLPQQPGLYQGFTAFDLVDYVAVLKEMKDRRLRHAEVRRVLESVGLGSVERRKLSTLSGGTRQRVAIAAALLGRPRLLVLDEPAAGLDPDERLRLRSVLSDAGGGGPAVVSTHQTSEVAAFCQHVLVMTDGRLRFSGTPEELAGLAAGRVWVDDTSDPRALRSWITSDGIVHNIGDPPAGARVVTPTLDDGYLLLTNGKVVT
ncbi:MAG: ATP-binding cassette domain-containing protein [Microthrixaceae bacterium]